MHIIDVLRGSKATKVMKHGHDRLSTYGIGKEYSRDQWLQLARQFLHKGLMVQDPNIIPLAVKRTYIAKYLERIADHATNISEMIIYMCKGKMIRHTEISDKPNAG